MKRISAFLFVTLFLFLSTSAQKVKFKEKLRVYIHQYSDSNSRVKFVNPKVDTLRKIVATFYHPDGSQTFQTDKKLNWALPYTLHWGIPQTNRETGGAFTFPSIINQKKFLLADVKADDDRILIYFWPFTGGKKKDSADRRIANEFLSKYEFSIPMDSRTNLGFRASASHAGALTLPFKYFFGSNDSTSAVQTGVTAGLYAGKRYGWKRFYKLPNEKEFTVYETSHSWNVFAGLTKLDLDDKNTADNGKKFTGSVGALSWGGTYGLHIKSFSVFVALGMDTPLSSKAEHWSLKGHPWIGFGAGFEIL